MLDLIKKLLTIYLLTNVSIPCIIVLLPFPNTLEPRRGVTQPSPYSIAWDKGGLVAAVSSLA
jgi:hypothetical protein